MFGFLQGTSHDSDDVNMAGHPEHSLLGPATSVASEGMADTPIESTGGVTSLSDGNSLSLCLNGDHSAATQPPSVVDSDIPGVSVSSVSFPSSQNEDLASEAVSVLIVFYFPFIPHIKSYTALTIQSSPKHSLLHTNLDQKPLKPFLLSPLFLILMPTKPLRRIAVK